MNKKKKKSRVPFRVNMVFFTVFLLFTILVIQLGIVQILEGDSYQKEISRTINDVSKSPVPRGKVFDRNGKIVVDNNPLYAITYTPPKRVQAEDKLKLAEELVDFISIEKKLLKKITDRNKKEYWYLKNTDEAVDMLTTKEREDLDDKEQYEVIIKERISDEEIKDFSDDEMQVMAIKRELDKAYSLTPEVIKNKNISVEEYAKIAEHLTTLPGINATTDWERKYVYGDTLKSILGSITSQDQGIPAEKENYYMTRGYNRNDRVGKSGIEEQYEDLLRGRKEQIEYTMTKSGDIVGSDVIVEGERGKDLVLTMDIDYQEKVDKLLLDELKAGRSRGNQYLKDVLAIVMNPKTGEILALSGQHYDDEKDEYENTPYKVFNDAHEPGSSIKGATVLSALQTGVMSPGEVINDSPIKIKDSNPKRSYRPGIGSVNDITALKESSNIYMFYSAMRMGGEYRYPFPRDATLNVNQQKGILTMRNYFQQFGLGVKTGLDFPSEATGYEGLDPGGADLLDFAIGQYDSYTTLQLAQYVSTIANDGYRVQPHLVKEIRSPAPNNEELGPVYQVNETKVLNKVSVEDNYVKRTKEGFQKVFNEQGGTGYSYWSTKPYKAAGKTGTAEKPIYEKQNDGTSKEINTENLALVGYAPYDDPEVAFAVMVPHLTPKRSDAINHKIGTGLLDLYFDTKEEDDDEK